MSGGHGVRSGHGAGAAVHSHGTAASAERGRLIVVLAITVAILVGEVVGGLLSHSLVLLADAAHMTADAGGIGLGLLAVSWAARPATSSRTFGFQRAEILAAVTNAVVLLVLGVFVSVVSVRRLVEPEHSTAGVMAVFGVVALIGNGAGLLLLRRGQGSSLNVRGAYLEVLTDVPGAAAVLAAAAIIAVTGWQRADPIAALFIGVLIVPRALRLLKQGADVLLEATPDDVDLDEVRAHICQTPGVVSCHDLHAWTVTSGNPVLSAHVVVEDAVWTDGRAAGILDRLGECLTGHFDVEHSTFQLEPVTHADHEAALHA